MTLRCGTAEQGLASVSTLFAVEPGELQAVLPAASRIALADTADPIRALPEAVAAQLGVTVRLPTAAHFFHGTRARDTNRLRAHGLRPLGEVLDYLWDELALLVPEVDTRALRRLRDELAAGLVGPHTYPLRVNGSIDHGPFGHLVRDVLLSPRSYLSVDYLHMSEIVDDICHALDEQFGVDAHARYRSSTTPCIVEFTAATEDPIGAVSSVLWYLTAAWQGEKTTNANWGFDARGSTIAPSQIVAVVELPDTLKRPA